MEHTHDYSKQMTMTVAPRVCARWLKAVACFIRHGRVMGLGIGGIVTSK